MTALARSLLRPSRIYLSSYRIPQRAALSLRVPLFVVQVPLPPSHRHNSSVPSITAPLPGSTAQKLGQIVPRLSITFTCTAPQLADPELICNHRSTHEFTKRSYEKGIVLVQCPECKNRHLIADHLGWFKESTEEGKLKTVEDLLRAKGETVKRGKYNFEGDIEYDGES
ncbi:hypothetical protein P7C73_g6758, partial [Tremellales sp. Uapishka_1]